MVAAGALLAYILTEPVEESVLGRTSAVETVAALALSGMTSTMEVERIAESEMLAS